MITETKPNGWDRAAMFGRWLRDKFAILFVTSWLYLLGWTIVLGAFSVLLYLDGKFSYNLAVGSSIAPAAFMAMGFMFRFFAAVFLMASERSRMLAKAERDDWPEDEETRLFKRRKIQEWERRGKVWRRIGLSISVLVCLHAIGIGLEALSHKRDTAAIERQVQDNLQENVNAQLTLLEGQKANIRSDLAVATAPLVERIDKLDNDGKLNEDRTDAIQARIDKLTDEAQVKIDNIDARKLSLIAPESDEEALEDATAKAEASEADEWAPLFIGIAQFVTQKKEPTDWAIYLCAVAFIVFWVLNAEAIVIFIPKELMKMHMQDAVAADKRGAKFDDPNFVVQPQIEAEGYWETRIAKALKTRIKNPTAQGIKDTYFDGVQSVAELRNWLNYRVKKGLLSQRDFDFIMREGDWGSKPTTEDTNSPTMNGADDADDTTTGRGISA